MHARSTGPVQLVITSSRWAEKPSSEVSGSAKWKCWALEAYGAAYTLQEMLTVKSDDVAGRTKIYENDRPWRSDTFEAGIPESFNVLVKEIRALCAEHATEKRSDADQWRLTCITGSLAK